MSKRKHATEVGFKQAVYLHRAGRLGEAEQFYRQILTTAPNHSDSLHMLGVLALQTARHAEALYYLEQAIARQPTVAIYHVNRANALRASGDLAAAVAACKEALRLKRNCAEASQTLGHILLDLGRSEEAVAAYRDALRQDPKLPDVHNNLGLALRQAGHLDEAVEILRRAAAISPQDAYGQSNLAGVLKELGRLDEAESLYRDVLRRHPEDAVAHYSLGLVLLLAGRLDEGWPEYEWRFQAGAVRVPACALPQWQGEPLAGRTLLVRMEQGFGTNIQFCRYATQVSGGRVILEVYPALRRLFSRLRGVEGFQGVASAGEALPRFDLYVPLMSLPRLLAAPSTKESYLVADPQRVASWHDRLGSHGLKIGVAWQGNPDSQAELGRSYPIACLGKLASLPDTRLISLQKHHGLDQLASAGLRIETPELDTGPDAFVDTAAVMQNLDLVVTSDTSIAHLAGAVGRPVWVALQHVPDWRWQLGRADCPWYPSMRLFRQTSRGDWDDVFDRIAEAIAHWPRTSDSFGGSSAEA
jgi:tetratricopeptide (TPR) repeat protein